MALVFVIVRLQIFYIVSVHSLFYIKFLNLVPINQTEGSMILGSPSLMCYYDRGDI